MAGELKDLFAALEATEDEVGAYRGRLKQAIAARRAARARRRRIGGGLGVVVAATLGLLFWRGPATVETTSVAELEAMVAAAPDPVALRAHARDRWQRGDGAARWDATLILALTGDDADARFGEASIERAMAAESDPLCLALLDDLLRAVS